MCLHHAIRHSFWAFVVVFDEYGVYFGDSDVVVVRCWVSFCLPPLGFRCQVGLQLRRCLFRCVVRLLRCVSVHCVRQILTVIDIEIICHCVSARDVVFASALGGVVGVGSFPGDCAWAWSESWHMAAISLSPTQPFGRYVFINLTSPCTVLVVMEKPSVSSVLKRPQSVVLILREIR